MKLLIPSAILSFLDKYVLLSTLLSKYLNSVSVESHMTV